MSSVPATTYCTTTHWHTSYILNRKQWVSSARYNNKEHLLEASLDGDSEDSIYTSQEFSSSSSSEEDLLEASLDGDSEDFIYTSKDFSSSSEEDL
jgi:hypothetical protein